MPTYRYDETGDQFTLRTFGNHGRIVKSGALASRPEWLVPIITMSKMCDYGIVLRNPPPDYIVWFVATSKHVFKEFIDVNATV